VYYVKEFPQISQNKICENLRWSSAESVGNQEAYNFSWTSSGIQILQRCCEKSVAMADAGFRRKLPPFCVKKVEPKAHFHPRRSACAQMAPTGVLWAAAEFFVCCWDVYWAEVII